MENAGDTIATQVFTQYYDSTVDSIIAGSQGMYLGTNVNAVPATAQDRFNNLYQAKSSFYESAGSFFVSDDVRVSGEYGVYITDLVILALKQQGLTFIIRFIHRIMSVFQILQ